MVYQTAPDRATRPTRHPVLFVVGYATVMTSIWAALLSPVIVTLPMKIREVAPRHPSSMLATTLAAGAVCAMLARPIFGQLSDLTLCRRNSRNPWLIGGAALGMAGVTVDAAAPNWLVLLLGWCVAQTGYNMLLAALFPLLVDRVPHSRRGPAAAAGVISLPIGQVLGTALAAACAPVSAVMFVLPAGLCLATVSLFVAAAGGHRRGPHPPVPVDIRPSLVQLLRRTWVSPRTYPQFGRVWLSRFLFFSGVSVMLTDQALFVVSIGVPAEQLPTALWTSTLVQSATTILAGAVSGLLTNLPNRRRRTAAAGACFYSAGLLSAAFADRLASFLAASALLGIGQGIYLSVDLALAIDLLPRQKQDAGKDLGVLDIASASPQCIVPLLTPLLLATGQGSFSALFAGAAACCLGAGVVVLRVRVPSV